MLRPSSLLAFFLLLSGAGITLPAQVPAPAPSAESPATAAAATPAPATPPAPVPVPLADVVAQAEAMTQRLQQMGVEPVPQTGDDVATALPLLTKEITTRLEEEGRNLAPGVSLETMRDIEERWQRVNTRLDTWTRDLTVRATAIDQQTAALPDLRTTWTATLALARSSAAPKEITQRVDGVIKAIDSTGTALQARRTALLSLQTRVAEQSQRVANAQRALAAAQKAAVNNLWLQDSPPLWTASARASQQDLMDRGQASLNTQWEQLGGYVRREWTKLVYLFLIFLTFAWLLPAYFSRYQKSPEEEEKDAKDPVLTRARRIIERPLSTASVLALMFTPLLFSEPPRLFWVMLAALGLIPIIILLRCLIERRLRPVLNLVILLFATAQIRALTAALPFVSRLILVAEMVGGLIFLLRFIRATDLVREKSFKSRSSGFVLRVCVLLFGLILVTNVLGYVALSTYLAAGFLASAYFAILIYGAARIIEGLACLALQVWPLTNLRLVNRHRPKLRRRIARVIYIIAFLIWGRQTLDAFSLQRSAGEIAGGFFNAEIAVGSLHLSLGSVFAFGLTLWLALQLSRFIRFVLEEDVYGRLKLVPGSSYAISTILHYIILVVGILAAFAAVGVDMTKLAILVGGLSVGIGFGMQNIFNNFFSGLILLFERPVHVGDVIDVGGVTGTVQRIGIRASSIRLADNSVLIVPNGALISEKVTDRTIPSRKGRIDLRVRVTAETDPQKVIQILTEVASEHPLVTQQPLPEAFMKEFTADSLGIDLLAWTEHPSRVQRISSDITAAANTALRAAGIALAPSPTGCTPVPPAKG